MSYIPQWMMDAASWCLKSGAGSLHEYYAEELRDNLFNGSLTLGGFLLAAYTFIVIHMKTSVFDSADYIKLFREKRAADKRLRLYGPLENLSRRLFFAVAITLVAGVAQLTVGLIPANIVAVACIATAIHAVYEVGYSLKLIGDNLRAWFASLDSDPRPPDQN